jgi:ketosteroid isomerase-like protein
MSQSIREAFDRGTEAFNSHDLDAFGELFAEDVVTTAPGGMRAEGKAAATQSYGVWFEGFPDARIDLDLVIITDDAAIEQGTFSGTQTGVLHSPDGDVPPTGRSVKAPYMQVLRFRGDKCVSADLMYDRLELLEQLGLVPQAAAS